MRIRAKSVMGAGIWVCGMLAACGIAGANETPSVELALSFRPVQKDVEYETPDREDFDQCEVKVERSGKGSGWMVLGPGGQVLRRFIDTNGNNVVDQWRYYNNGLEVYRDIDSNFDNKVDQSRWLNTGGSRWGFDENGDGRIDSWKVISAEETSREAVRALVDRDEKALQALLINREDLTALGMEEALAEKLLESVSHPGQKLRKVLSESKIITSGSRWMRFDSSMPGTIPADAGKADDDLTVYQNAMAIVETAGEPGLVRLGEMIRLGKVWKLTQIPQPLEGSSVEVTAGLLMQPDLPSASPPAAAGGVSPEMQPLLEELQELDQNSPAASAPAAELTRYNRQRADLLARLVEMSETEEDRGQWTRQMVDGIAASVQSGSYPEGLDRLKSLESEVQQSGGDRELLAYISYRRLLSEYSHKLKNAGSGNAGQVQEWWLEELENFVEEHPQTDDAPDALLQLAITHEFGGQTTDARKWYGTLVDRHPETTAGARAAGAVRRLELKDKPFHFSASGLDGGTVESGRYRGKVLLVVFWATWCQPCTEDLPQIRALYQKHRNRGFEVLGVNLDSTSDPVSEYLRKHRVSWPQVHEPGGLQSGPAKEFGIISLPTMFLVDKSGTVVNRGISIEDLKTEVPELLKK